VTTTSSSSTSSTATKGAAGATTNDFLTEVAKQSSEQLVRAMRQTAKFSFEATSAWLDTVAKVVPSVPAIPFAPSEETVKVWTDAGFDVAQNVLDLQREITGELLAKVSAFTA
jgi:hypothetical protein